MKPIIVVLSAMLLGILRPVNSQTTVLHDFISERNQTFFFNGVITDGEFLYGTKHDGGEYGDGYIYKIKTDNSGYEILLNFRGDYSGAYPSGSLVISGNSLYGVTFEGGEYNSGTIYKINTDGSDYQKLHDFSDGYGPQSLIIFDQALYGVSRNGGIYGNGFIFKIDIDGSEYRILHSFSNTEGGVWSGRLVTDGFTIFGTTFREENGYNGIIYKVSIDGTDFTILHEFERYYGGQLASGLVLINKSLYGTTFSLEYSIGELYKINTDGTGFEVLRNFEEPERFDPYGLVQYESYLYGMTGSGTVFSIDTTGATFNTLIRLDKNKGGLPYVSTLASYGSVLYGYVHGGSYNYGVVFSVNMDGSGFSRIKEFTATNDGYDPQGALVVSSSKYFGITNGGGTYNKGTIFSVNYDGSDYQVVYNFTDDNGTYPSGSLVIYHKSLYGMTFSGGSNNMGVVFKFTPDGNEYKKLLDFDGINGGYPSGTLCISDAKIYGMTEHGGAEKRGVIFSMNPDGTGFTKLFDFSGTNVNNLGGHVNQPPGSLVYSDSLIFGMANDSAGNNLLFSIHSDGTDFKILYVSDGIDAGQWGQSLISGGEYLYEITSQGGMNNLGVLFRIKKDGSSFEKLFDFNYDIGASPNEPLILADSWLYGTSCCSGSDLSGSVFKIGIDGTDFANIMDLGTISIGVLTLNENSLYIFAKETAGHLTQGKVIIYNLLATGTDDGIIPEAIKIYPNPANQLITIEGMKRFPARVQICNSLGIRVIDCIVNDNQLDIGRLQSGIYTLIFDNQCLKIIKL